MDKVDRFPAPRVGAFLAWLLAVLMWLCGAAAVSQPVQARPVPPNAAASAAPGEMQPQRLALINKLIGMGVFQKIEKPRQLPYLWVKPGFYQLDFEMKQKFVGVVYMYFKTDDPGVQLVVLYDSRTGKRAGRFSENLGGLNLD